MRIAYLSDVRIPSRAASVVHVLKMCEALVKLGHSVTLFFASNEDIDPCTVGKSYGIEHEFEYFGVRKVQRRGLAYWYAVRIGLIAARRRFDLALCRSLPGAVICAALGVPTIYEAHMPAKEKGVVTDFLFRALLGQGRVQGLVVISEALKRYYEENYDLRGKTVMVVPDAASRNISKNFGKRRQGKLNVGYVGHLYPGRGIGLLIQLAGKCRWLHMHVVGGEPDDVEFWKRASSGVSNITFYGHVDFAETDGYREMCDVLVAPYQDEVLVSGNRTNTAACMSPLKLFEYMASRKAIVCSDLPVLRELFKEGEHAVFCKVDDVDDWCRALENLREDQNYRDRLASNAFGLYEAKYTWDQRARRIIESFS